MKNSVTCRSIGAGKAPNSSKSSQLKGWVSIPGFFSWPKALAQLVVSMPAARRSASFARTTGHRSRPWARSSRIQVRWFRPAHLPVIPSAGTPAKPASHRIVSTVPWQSPTGRTLVLRHRARTTAVMGLP